jgi:hypothetical protein
MACSCKNKQTSPSRQTTQRMSNPLNNGNIHGGRRIEKRVIR